MGVALSSLTARLAAAVTARNGTPSAAQYGQAVEDAAADFSRRCARQKRTTLSITAGTAAYAVPADLLYVIRMPAAYAPGAGVLITDAGIVPVDSLIAEGPARWYEEWNVEGGTITFYPTPTEARTQEMWYAAGHVLNAGTVYPDMTEDDARCVLLKAQANALDLKANAAAEEGWSYSLGQESVNKAGLPAAMREQAGMMEARYEKAMMGRAGAWGERGTYDATGQ
jgi:hypothetical protein